MKVLITGASGKIGKAIAARFTADGHELVLHHDTSSGNFSDASVPDQLIDSTVSFLKGLDLLIHCAASFERTPLEEVTEPIWDRVMAINLKAAFFICQAAARAMKAQGGKIILFSDVAGANPYAGYLPHCIAKAGVDCLTKGMAKAYAPHIFVNAVAPFLVTRPPSMSDEVWKALMRKAPDGREEGIEEIVELVTWLGAPQTTVTGQVITVRDWRTRRN